jgi:hypothetical protein
MGRVVAGTALLAGAGGGAWAAKKFGGATMGHFASNMNRGLLINNAVKSGFGKMGSALQANLPVAGTP